VIRLSGPLVASAFRIAIRSFGERPRPYYQHQSPAYARQRKTHMTKEFKAEFETIAREIKAEEARAAEVARKVEQKKKALLERGSGHCAEVLDGHRQQALASLRRAQKALADLGPAPAAPTLDGVTGAEAFADECELRAVEREAHGKAVEQICLRLHREAHALHKLSSDARREARELGFETPDGVAFVLEHVRHHARYNIPIGDWLGSLGYAAPMIVDPQRIALLIDALSEPVPEPQAPSPTYPAGVAREPRKDGGWIARGWARIGQALADDVPAPRQSQTDRDAERVMQRSPEEQRYDMERQQGIRP
jgi:hypothetical protein